MAYQLIYTSVKSGLVAGRSGFCTAARHKDIAEALVGRIESLSGQYDRGSAATRQGGALPVIYSHRIVGIRGREWHLLMRVADAGNDYSGRTNHIAHTFVFEPEEVARIPLTPAETILHLLREGRWAERYLDNAKFFGPGDEFHPGGLAPLVGLPARTWQDLTGSAANAALLMEPKAAMGAGVVNPDGFAGEDLLRLFGESQLLGSPARTKPSALWTRSFTTLMQSSDQRGDFDWYACDYNGPVHMQVLKADRFVVEVGKGLPAPRGRFADLAQGLAVAAVEERDPVRTEASIPAVSPQATPVAGAGAVLASATVRPVGDLLKGASSNDRSRKKGGLPGWVLPVAGGAILGLLAAAYLLLFGESKAEAFSRESFVLFDKGDWSAVKGKLKDLPDETKSRYRDEDAAFSSVERAVKVAEMYQWILEHEVESSPAEAQAPSGDGTATFANYLKKAEAEKEALRSRLGQAGIERSVPAFLVEMQKDVRAKVGGHERSQQRILDAWASLEKGETEVAGHLLRDIAKSTPADSVEAACARDLKTVIPVMEGFAKLGGPKFASQAEADKAKAGQEGLLKTITAVAAAAEGRPWSESVNRIFGTIGAYKPVYDPPRDPNLTDTGKSKGPTEPKPEVPVETKVEIKIPPTYLWPVSENSTYSYAEIVPPGGELPFYRYLSSKTAYDENGLAEIRTQPKLLPEKIYHEKSKTPTSLVFTIAASGKTLSRSTNLQEEYKDGFLLAFGATENAVPDFQVLAQRPSASVAEAVGAPFFLELPLPRLLEKNGGAIALTGEAKNALATLRLPSPESVFHLVWTQEGGAASSMANAGDPESLKADLVTGFDAAIRQAEADLESYASLKTVGEDIERVFGKLGETLFCNPADGKVLLYKLEYQLGRDARNNPVFIQTPVEDGEATGVNLFKTLADYKAKANDGRPPLIGYVNFSLYDVYKAYATDSNSILSSEDVAFIEERFLKVTNPDGWGPQGTANVLKAWGEITNRSKERKWSERPEIDPVASEDKAKDRQRRYRTNRYRADFFRQWELTFTPENIEIARKFLLGGEFKQEEFDKRRAALDTLKRNRESVASQPIETLGQFYVVAQSGAWYFRIIRAVNEPAR